MKMYIWQIYKKNDYQSNLSNYEFKLPLLTLYLPVPSAYNLCKQFAPRSASTERRGSSETQRFGTLMIFLKEFNFEKNQQTKKSEKVIACKEIIIQIK